MREWMAEVRGPQAQLDKAREILTSSSSSMTKDGDRFYLMSDEFRLLGDAREVRDRAADIIGRMAGVARLHGDEFELELGPVARRRPDGKHDQFIFPETLVVWTRFPSSQPSSLVTELAERDEQVARVLRLYDRPETWDNLYKVLEAVNEDVGELIWTRRWASKPEVDLFKRTANSRPAIGDDARHGDAKYDPPKVPMTLIDAHILVKRIVASWIDFKSSPPQVRLANHP